VIKTIELENFKCVGKRVRVDLAPLTFLFGANSVGKSTLIQSLIYTHEVLVNWNPDANVTERGGAAVQLGGFKSIVHNRDLKKPIKIRMAVEVSSGFTDNIEDLIFSEDHVSGFELLFGILSFEMCIVWDGNIPGPFISSYNIELDDIWLCEVSSSVDSRGEIKSWISRINWIHPNFLIKKSKLISEVHSLNTARKNNGLPEIVVSNFESDAEIYGGRTRSILTINGQPSDLSEFELSDIRRISVFYGLFRGQNRRSLKFGPGGSTKISVSFHYPTVDFGIPKKNQTIQFNDDEWVIFDQHDEGQALVRNTLKEMLLHTANRVRCELTKMIYLGPIRKMPPREISRPQIESDLSTSWETGLSAWDGLHFACEDEIEQISDWLGNQDRLDTGYRLRKTSFKRIECGSRAMAVLSGEMPLRNREEAFEEVKTLQEWDRIVLEEIDSGLEMEPQDVGAGISQILPVVVAAVGSRGRTVCIEQPELHMHPRVQANLGDLFISQVCLDTEKANSSLVDNEPHLTGRAQFFLETHSEHLILRIMRRMRETANDHLVDPSLTLHPDDVSVIYVEQTDSGTVFRVMPLNERGELVKAWPGGFFEEGLEEML